jgi:hypothetical protein
MTIPGGTMNIVSKHTALVALAAVLCLHAVVVPARGAELMSNPMLEDADSSFKKHSSKQNARQRDGESVQRQRRESSGREQTLGNRSGDERRQRDDGQARFARPTRERGGSFQADASRGGRSERPRGFQTAMNAQEGIVPPEEVLRLDGQKGKGERRERPEEGQRQIRRTEGERQGRSRAGSTLNAQEGIVPPKEMLQLDPQRQDRSRTEDSGRGGHRSGDGQGRRDGDGTRFGTSGGDGRRDHRYDDGKGRRDGDGIRFGTSGDDNRRGDHRYDDGRDRRNNDSFRFGSSRRDDDKRHDVRRHDDDRRRPHFVKHVIHHIPPRHAVILHGRDRYHYHSGRFYRPWEGGFILVRPPLGLIVFDIPLGSRILVSAGITYHVFGDVFYRRVPTGYEVVEPIRERASHWPDQVTVATDLLNVRYGPDDDEEVIAQVERYTVLNVIGSVPGWLYIEIEDEDVRGWIMERYVVPGAGRG